MEEKTFKEIWLHIKHSIKHVYVFRCNVYAHFQNKKCIKLHPKRKKYIFLSYVMDPKCYYFYDVENGSLIKSRDTKFVECKDSK